MVAIERIKRRPQHAARKIAGGPEEDEGATVGGNRWSVHIVFRNVMPTSKLLRERGTVAAPPRWETLTETRQFQPVCKRPAFSSREWIRRYAGYSADMRGSC